MGDLTREQRTLPVEMVDEVTGLSPRVQTVGGVPRLATDSAITSVNVPLGKDPLPDTFFNIVTAGSAGDTIRIVVAGTTGDSTVPDRDVPAVDYTYTLVAADVGDEQQLCDNLAEAINQEIQFENAFLEAESVDNGDNGRAVLHLTSTKFSLNGEFFERPIPGDFNVITTGTTTVQFDTIYETIVSRAKEVSLARDPNSPHLLGIQSISGTVRVRADEIEFLLKELFTEQGGTSTQLAINGGGGTIFEVSANPAGGRDKIIERLEFFGNDGNIKVADRFLGLNSDLNNGILVRIFLDNVVVYQEPLITTTTELLGVWSNTAAENKIISQSGGDYIESSFDLVQQNVSVRLRAGKQDRIECVIQDNLSSVQNLKLLATGFEED